MTDRLSRSQAILRGFVCFGLLMGSLALAQRGNQSDQLVSLEMTQDLITMDAKHAVESMVLVITGPGGYIAKHEFSGKETIYIDTLGLNGDWLRDGQYTFEVTGTPQMDADLKASLLAARANGESVNLEGLRKDGLVPRGTFKASGYFRVTDGQFIVPESLEPTFLASKTDAPGGANNSGSNGRDGDIRPGDPVGGGDPGGTRDFGDVDNDLGLRDQVIADDLIVQQSACVGQDCTNGESFGFDTIRLKENNLRIKFQDTSVSASFPSNDWQLTANDSTNGGANKFSIDDIDGGRTPFTVEASAPSHSLYVDDGGRIGFGTSTPVVEHHIKNGDSPTVRLEQDGSSGFTPQTWDMAGNETNWFVRDATNGSRLPFKIRPSAPTNSLYVDTDGGIGLGTASVSADLHLLSTDGDGQFLLEEKSGTPLFREMVYVRNNGNIALTMENTDNNTIWQLEQNNGDFRIDFAGVSGSEFIFFKTGRVVLGPGTGGVFDLSTTGDLAITGALSMTSDRNVKENVVPVDEDEVLARVAELPISTWNYINQSDKVRHMGPMAQDFYQAFGLNNTDTGISSLDTSGVAFAAIKSLNTKLEEKDAKIDALQKQNEDMAAKLAQIEAMMEEVNRKLIQADEDR